MDDTEQVTSARADSAGSREASTEPTSAAREPFLGRASLRLRIRLINGIFAAGIIVFAAITHVALQVQLEATDELTHLTAAQEYAEDADRLHDGLRGDLYASLLAPGMTEANADRFVRLWQSEITRFRDDLEQQSKLDLPADVERNIVDTRQRAEEFIVRTQDLLQLSKAETGTVAESLPDFEQRFEALGTTFDKLHSVLSGETLSARERVAAARNDADRSILIAAAIIIGATMLLTWTITYSIRRSVYRVSHVARSLSAGELDVRYDQTTSDELGAIGAALNAMAESLQATMSRLRADSERDRFGKQLADALEIADTEGEIADVTSRAMTRISPDRPMELLIAGGAQAPLQRLAENPSAGCPGCGVQSPANCVAVRRGNIVEFTDSEQLDSCPYLRDREGGPLSAVCIPLSFMGSSLGVLHVTGEQGAPPGASGVVALESLALQVGTRIGTVRAFRRTRRQALTDSMTGLSNRRALEHDVEDLARSGTRFAVVMADLDRFKTLNDSFGHQAGDRALRLFADVIRGGMRAGDLAARWGGEEFVIVLSGASSGHALEWTERTREQLAEACARSDAPAFTVSFGIADSSMWPDLPGLLSIADDALYRSKSEGRDRSTIGRVESALAGDPDADDGSDDTMAVKGVSR